MKRSMYVPGAQKRPDRPQIPQRDRPQQQQRQLGPETREILGREFGAGKMPQPPQPERPWWTEESQVMHGDDSQIVKHPEPLTPPDQPLKKQHLHQSSPAAWERRPSPPGRMPPTCPCQCHCPYCPKHGMRPPHYYENDRPKHRVPGKISMAIRRNWAINLPRGELTGTKQPEPPEQSSSSSDEEEQPASPKQPKSKDKQKKQMKW